MSDRFPYSASRRSEAHSFYVLLRGRLLCTTLTTGQRKELTAPTPITNEGVCFGIEGMAQCRRLTTVSALDECTLLHFATGAMRIDEHGAASLAAQVFKKLVEVALRGSLFFQVHASPRRCPHARLPRRPPASPGFTARLAMTARHR